MPRSKILISIILTILTQTQADLPPLNRYRPSKSYALSLHGPSPQLHYGSPSKITKSSSLKIPGGLTIEDLIRLTEKLQMEKEYPSEFKHFQHNKPQKLFKPPPPRKQFQDSTNYKTITEVDFSNLKTSYGAPPVPQNKLIAPQTPYIPPQTQVQSQNSNNQLTPPRTSYGVPVLPEKNVFKPQTQYGAPDNNVGVEPLNKYQTLPLSNQANNVWNNNNLSNEFSTQYLPIKEAGQFRPSNNNQHVPESFNNKPLIPQGVSSMNPTGFGLIPNQHPQNHFKPLNPGVQPAQIHPQTFSTQPNIFNQQGGDRNNVDSQSPYDNTNFAQIPPQKNNFNNVNTVFGQVPTQPNPLNNHQPNPANNFNTQTTSTGQQNGGRYLPPVRTTTMRNQVFTTEQPVPDSTTDVKGEDNNNQFTEPPPTGTESQDPNISIATAVAGADPSLFYLQQPDGRLQKVILERVPDPSGKPEEYTANYYFQNIESVPNVVYSPLITLG